MIKIIRILRLFIYVFAVIFAQDIYFFTTNADKCVSNDDMSTRTWVNLEITSFYMNIAGSVVFLILSKCCIRKSGLMIESSGDLEEDFLTRHHKIGSIFTRAFLTCISPYILLITYN